jgi:hypothetical protein
MAQLQWNEVLKNPAVRTTAIGIGVAVLVPVTVKLLAPILRPVARSTMKVGLVALEKGRETAAELGEIFDDLVAEVREEMRMEREAAADAGDGRVAAEISERGSPSEPS